MHAGIRSDALAGGDVARGAAWAAVRTADVNLAALERAGAVETVDARHELAARRDAVRRRLDARATDLDPREQGDPA